MVYKEWWLTPFLPFLDPISHFSWFLKKKARSKAGFENNSPAS